MTVATKTRRRGGLKTVTGSTRASPSRKRRSDFAPATDYSGAATKSNGRSVHLLPPIHEVNGHSYNNAGGGSVRDADLAGAASDLQSGRDVTRDSERECASSEDASGDTTAATETTAPARISRIAAAIQGLHAEREAIKRSRVRIENELRSGVATVLGYHNGLPEKERATFAKRADLLIKYVRNGELFAVRQDDRVRGHRAIGRIMCMSAAREPILAQEKAIEKEMGNLAAMLPVAEWTATIRGVGKTSQVLLAMIVGECGDLNRFPNPAKLWAWCCLAPRNGKMPATHRRDKTATSDDWKRWGYSPRRRSIMFQVGDCIVKNNDGIYRQRYDDARAAKDGLEGWPDGRLNYHGNLLATKLFIKDLWKQWTGK